MFASASIAIRSRGCAELPFEPAEGAAEQICASSAAVTQNCNYPLLAMRAIIHTIPRRMTYRQIPNLITTARLVLSIVFFSLLSWYQYEGRGHSTLLTWAFFICLIAIFTDYIDGYLARRWKVESGFGRVVDPFVDKILVLGSFVFFAGKNFIIPDSNPAVAGAGCLHHYRRYPGDGGDYPRPRAAG